MHILPKSFYERLSTEVAPDLLGLYLAHEVNGEKLVGKIVEVEAYMGPMDKAAHSYNNLRTPRNEIMYGQAGFAYVYFIYGMYYCVNVVTSKINSPQAVLIRAIEPMVGLDKMAMNRYNKPYNELTKTQIYNLTSGPGKLCQAMQITTNHNGLNFSKSSLKIYTNDEDKNFEIATSRRVNIDYAEEAKDYLWRFYIKNNPYVSKVKTNL